MQFFIQTLEFVFDFLWQLIIRATRTGGVSPQTAESTITIRINRNLNGPVFYGLPYSESISDTTEIGTIVADVNAVDADGVSIVVRL